MENITYLTEETYGPITTGSAAAVVDFYADWCGPCQAMGPIFEQCSVEYGDISFCKVNVDEHKKLAIQNRVLGIPCFMFFKNGKMLKRIDGAVPESAFRDALNILL